MKDIVIGIDVGGTNIKIGLVTPQGRIAARAHLPTSQYAQSRESLIAAITQECRVLMQIRRLDSDQILGIGIGLPGLVNPEKGIVYSLTNISGWKNVQLKKIIETQLKIPVFIDNDVNVMTLAEWTYGAGRGMTNMICITIGTGLGGGLIINNALYRGEGFAAGELGHVPLNEQGQPCNCGGWGCLEAYVGNRYLSSRAQAIFKKNITLEQVTRQANQGHAKAIAFWRQVGEHIGNGLTGVVNVLNPSCIVIGGGIAQAHRHMFQVIQETIKKRAMHVQGKMVRIVKSQLGSDAGVVGARALVKEMLGEHA